MSVTQKPKTPRFGPGDRQRYDQELKQQHLSGSWTRQHLNKLTVRALREMWTTDEETSKPLEKGSTNPEATRTKGRVTTSQWDDKCQNGSMTMKQQV